VGLADLRYLIEQDGPQVVGHRNAESTLVFGEGGVLAPLAFRKQGDGAAVVDACPHIQPFTVDPAAEARRRLNDSAQRDCMPFERIGEDAPLIREQPEKLLETRIADVFGLGIFETAVLIQTAKIKQFPLVLMGVDYWKPLIGFLESTLQASHAINQEDLRRIHLTDSVEEAAELIRDQAIHQFGLTRKIAPKRKWFLGELKTRP